MKHYMSEFEKKIGSIGSAHNFASVAPQIQTHDVHLTAKYERAREKAERLQEMGQPGKMEELEKIKQHVEDVRAEHRKELSKYSSGGKKKGNTKKPAGGAGFTELRIETRQDVTQSSKPHIVASHNAHLSTLLFRSFAVYVAADTRNTASVT